jgi:predicted GNAT family acetyltransferase
MASVAYKFDSSSLPIKLEHQVTASWQFESVRVTAASAEMEAEILSALSNPSLTNVIMAGFIRDNGITSVRNRGRFYVCHNAHGELQGVALIGHTILFEAFTEDALASFAKVARRESSSHLLMGQHQAVQRFWNYYADAAQLPRQVCPILFLRRHAQFEEQPKVSGLRQATPEDLEQVVRAQADMALETSGVNPLQRDPVGFRQRYLQRIDKRRVWVLMRNGRLLFKADVIADTPEATYIEGIYVSPEERGKGLGRSCLTMLGQIFLQRTKAIYLFVEAENTRTRSFYLNLGFNLAGQYDLLYF